MKIIITKETVEKDFIDLARYVALLIESSTMDDMDLVCELSLIKPCVTGNDEL